MRRPILSLLLISCVLTIGAVRLYRDPRVRGLFKPTPLRDMPARVPEKAARPAAVSSTERVRPKEPKREARAPSSARANSDTKLNTRERSEKTENEAAAPIPKNRTPNATLSRVLMQILAARQLAGGVSIAATDDRVLVAGAVGSEEKRRKILEIVEKARENREIDATNLLVHQVPENQLLL
jgi:hypothetical protein